MSSGPGRDGNANIYGTPLSLNSQTHHSRNPSASGSSGYLPPNSHNYATSPRAPQQGGGAMYSTSQSPYSPVHPHAPNLHFQQATPQGSQMSTPHAGHVPDALTPGGTPRNAPHQQPMVPTLPSNNPPQHYVPPPRAGTSGPSHGHSKSSPIGLDQRYVPFSNSPSATPTSASRGMPPQSFHGSVSYSPLGLSDIRPSHGDLGIDMTGGGYNSNEPSMVQTNSNYLAPWPVYALDWCKWPVSSGGSCGKAAIGSYLEDAHNFVSHA